MSVFIVSHDEFATALIEQIRTLKSVKIGSSAHLVSFNDSARELWEYFSSYISKSDMLVIMRLTPDCYGRMSEAAKSWIEQARRDGTFN